VVDARQIVVSGQSYGGWNTLAFGTLGHVGVKGIIDFAGGMRTSDCASQDASLIAAAATFGARAKLPALWLYGDNDKQFPASTWRAMYQRYTAVGGQAELVAYGSFMDDAHQLLSHAESQAIWVPRVDAFLARVGLPSRLVYPAYLPTPFPPATRYASIDDVQAVPYLDDNGRADYRAFLQRSWTRVFVVSPSGVSTAADGGFDPAARALNLCRQHASGCQLYAVDDDVVWTPQADVRPAPRVFTRVVPAGAPTILNFAFAVNPDCSSKGVPRVWVTQKPAHGAATVERRTDAVRFPPNHPYAVCNGTPTQGTAVVYTPTAGFMGADSVTFEEVNLDRRDRVFQIAITVK
jgi:hypothetical protein